MLGSMFWVFVAACIPNLFCTPDDGVGQVVKCRLIDAATVTRNLIKYQSVGTQTKMRIYIDEDEEENRVRSPSIPDILKTGLPPGRKELMSKLIQELTMRFETKVEKESVSLLPERRNPVIPGSPTGFSSTDDTCPSIDLSYDDPGDVGKSITSLEEHIGQDFEGAIESDSSICGMDRFPAKLFYPDLTAPLFKKLYDVPHRDLSVSSESLFAEQDNMSLRTYVSSPDISLIGFDDIVTHASHSTSYEDITEDTVVSCNKEDKYLVEDGLQMDKHQNSELFKDGCISISDNCLNSIKVNGNNLPLCYFDSSDEMKIDPTENTKNNFSLTDDVENENAESALSPVSDVLFAAYSYDSGGNLKERNMLTSEVEDGSASGYEGDSDRTLYEALVLSKFTLDFSPASTTGYEADCDEMTTSFTHSPNILYTIYEETPAEI